MNAEANEIMNAEANEIINAEANEAKRYANLPGKDHVTRINAI